MLNFTNLVNDALVSLRVWIASRGLMASNVDKSLPAGLEKVPLVVKNGYIGLFTDDDRARS